MKVLKWSQHFSHFKSIGIVPDARGQLTPRYVIGSGRNPNSFENLWLCVLPDKMKTIQSKLKALEWPQDHIVHPFFRLPMADTM